MSLETGEIKIAVDGAQIRTIAAEFISLPFGRGAPIGRANDGSLYAGFSAEGPALESILVQSTDGGRTWTEQRLDWWTFFDQSLEHDSLRFHFWDFRWALRSDAFGVLGDGTLLWAFQHTPEVGNEESYIIRSQDRGETWEGPVKIDKTPFSSVGNASNRMTELADGTVLWPQRLGLSEAEFERAREEGEKSGQPPETSALTVTYVFRSTDQGQTWGDRTPLPDWSFETTILRLRSGRLLAAIRYQPLVQVDAPWGEFGKRVFLADSEDQGRTWVDFRPLRQTPDGPVDLEMGECHGELSELSDGTLVLTHDRRYPRDQAQLLARISRDQGQTWTPEVYGLTLPGGTVLGSSRRGYGTGYASSVVLEDDTIVTLTGAGTCVRWRVE